MAIDSKTAIAIIAVAAVCTFATRLFPFALFSKSETIPKSVQYLGKVLPPAVIATLVIYCLKDVNFLQFPSGIAELISIALVFGIHAWKKNTLLSIGLGTACYMILIRTVFA